jgi:hypothetical protein
VRREAGDKVANQSFKSWSSAKSKGFLNRKAWRTDNAEDTDLRRQSKKQCHGQNPTGTAVALFFSDSSFVQH